MEFYATCADIIIENERDYPVPSDTTYIGQGFPHLPQSLKGYRRPYRGQFGTEYFLGPKEFPGSDSGESTAPGVPPQPPRGGPAGMPWYATFALGVGAIMFVLGLVMLVRGSQLRQQRSLRQHMAMLAAPPDLAPVRRDRDKL